MIVIYVLVGIGFLANMVENEGQGSARLGADETTTTQSIAESSSTTHQATTTTRPTTTTSLQTTTTPSTSTTTTLPVIGAGVYLVPTEVAHGVYRFSNYMARLDSEQEIIDNGLVSGNGLGLMVVLEGDAYAEISGEAILYDNFGPVDPVVQQFDDGTYLVEYDIEPGRYRISPVGSVSAYWARLDQTLDIIDNNLSDGQLIVVVDDSDFALSFSGTIERLP